MQKTDNRKVTWRDVEKRYADLESGNSLASEAIKMSQMISRSKDFTILGLIIGMVAMGIGMSVINCLNNYNWRERK